MSEYNLPVFDELMGRLLNGTPKQNAAEQRRKAAAKRKRQAAARRQRLLREEQ